MYKITLYVPISHAEEVKNAMFEAGAGRIGNYSHCCWEVTGIGQFQALSGANPHLGVVDQLEKVEEKKIEMVCEKAKIKQVITSLKKAHPYETAAYQVTEILEF